ncbi:MAG: hypothetical protein N2504_02680 [candidate division WOR-3 bacterium]|nr:hypothetical protein [candidate division WOR-3 bacterium]MCX7947479.1 hypothetical protein [candidate division WOR-3 bacterium]MDW8150638.1 CorA family divalent cation transporter [candidate division WOR-3 bacterium]
MVIKVIKTEKDLEDLKLKELFSQEFLNGNPRVKFEKFENVLLFKLVVSMDKVFIVLMNKGQVIYRSFGFDIENYISKDINETIFKVFQDIGSNELDELRNELTKVEELVFSEMEKMKFNREVIKKLYNFKKVVDNLSRYYFLQEDLIEDYIVDKRVLFQVRRIRTALEKLSQSVNTLISVYLEMIGTISNDIMKFLTVIATIFIPLTFLAGVYGMNFEHFPELKWKYSYFFFWLFTIVFIVSSIIYFKKRHWI